MAIIRPLVTLFSFLGLMAVLGTTQARDYHYTDAHLHYVDFFQESAGMESLLAVMDEYRIDHAMISGIPVAKK